MWGEAMMSIESASRRINELEREREIFALAGEDSLHPFVYRKRLKEIDMELAACQADIDEWGAAIDEMIASEAGEWDADEDEGDGEGPEPFGQIFQSLCEIDGIDAAAQLDAVKTAEQLMLDDLHARREMLEI